MTNYFGKARLKKIFYSYLSTDPKKEKAFKKSEKEQRAIAKEYGRSYTVNIMVLNGLNVETMNVVIKFGLTAQSQRL